MASIRSRSCSENSQKTAMPVTVSASTIAVITRSRTSLRSSTVQAAATRPGCSRAGRSGCRDRRAGDGASARHSSSSPSSGNSSAVPSGRTSARGSSTRARRRRPAARPGVRPATSTRCCQSWSRAADTNAGTARAAEWMLPSSLRPQSTTCPPAGAPPAPSMPGSSPAGRVRPTPRVVPGLAMGGKVLCDMVSNPPAPSPAAVAVVLVTFQSARDLAMCLGSLERATGPHPLEVVVVDNASTDASVEIARGYGAKVLENHANLGLSRAINAGVAITGAPWLLIANPDTWLSPGSLRRMLATATSDPRIGCVGPHLANPDGSDYPSRPLTVDWVSGACMLIRRQAFEEVGGFDPAYFMYFEEMDLCLRLHRAGWRVVFDPLAEVKHVVGGSTRSAPYAKVIHHHRSALRFYCRRYARDPRLVMAPLVAAFLAVRGVASLARTAVAQRREAGREHPLAVPGPDEFGRPQA